MPFFLTYWDRMAVLYITRTRGVFVMVIEKISGEIKRIFYQHENGFAIAQLKVDKGHLITVLGNMPGLVEGCPVEILDYNIENNARYGQQYRVKRCNMPVPSTKDGVIAFLSSGLIRGVGAKRARIIVNALGENAIDEIINKGPDVLVNIPGIGKKSATKIYDSVNEHYALQGIMQELVPLGLSPNLVMKAYRHFGPDVVNKIRHNPYDLMELWGVGFLRADVVAQKMGIKHNALIRLKAAAKHVLQLASVQGHCFLPASELLDRLVGLLNNKSQGVEPELVEEALQDMRRSDHGVVFDDNKGRIYLSWLYVAEEKAAAAVDTLLRSRSNFDDTLIDDAILRYCKKSQLLLTPEQRKAVKIALTNGLSILTGGPGTGKTQTIKAVCGVAAALGYKKIALCAPTGRASRVMADVTGREASTIHRLIGLQPGEIPLYGKEAPLPHDLIIVDEAGMMDVSLARYYFEAIAPDSQVLLVGDKDQLAPVGPGNVFADLLRIGVPTVELTRVFRQSAKSMIAENARLVNEGKIPSLRNDIANDFFYIFREDPEEVTKMVRRAYRRLLEKGFSVQDIQVLSPMRKGLDGVNNLNKTLQAEVNPPRGDKGKIIAGNTIFRVGDKVMQIKNNYEKQVFNGEVGIIDFIGPASDDDDDEVVIRVNYGNGNPVEYLPHELDELVLAYAVTVHKSQGSEYPAVILAISTAHYLMLSRRILYTAISRAKNIFVLVGSKKAVAIAVKNDAIEKRHTALTERIAFRGDSDDLNAGKAASWKDIANLFGAEAVVFDMA